jgi:hypothetical protein
MHSKAGSQVLPTALNPCGVCAEQGGARDGSRLLGHWKEAAALEVFYPGNDDTQSNPLCT